MTEPVDTTSASRFEEVFEEAVREFLAEPGNGWGAFVETGERSG